MRQLHRRGALVDDQTTHGTDSMFAGETGELREMCLIMTFLVWNQDFVTKPYAPKVIYTSHAVSLGPASHPRHICRSGLDTDRNSKIQVEGTIATYRPPQQGARPPLFELGCQ